MDVAPTRPLVREMPTTTVPLAPAVTMPSITHLRGASLVSDEVRTEVAVRLYDSIPDLTENSLHRERRRQ